MEAVLDLTKQALMLTLILSGPRGRQAIPAARITKVTDSETVGGTFSIPSISATITLPPMNTSSTASACLR